ncbi:MAG: YbjN domain-containing protein [Actinomycetota bacterium]|nr:YbjN domain-containing protein [Actinomycetota bacterium]
MNIEITWLRAYVEKLLRESFLEGVEADGDGDYPFRWGTAACWVRVDDRPFARVEVFAHVVHGVRPSARLLREVNDANRRVVGGRVYEWDGMVVAAQSIHAHGLQADTLAQACVGVGTVADDLGALLAAMFDGQTPYRPEPVAFEPPSLDAEGA